MQHRRGTSIPEPSPNFAERKTKILKQLDIPESEYQDASPKGTVDHGIRHLIDEINGVAGLVTTSSCAGRVSVFLEGRKTPRTVDGTDPSRQQIAGVGGKGAGGTWLYVSHDPVPGDDWIDALALPPESRESHEEEGPRWIHFKFEPMILHVLTASLVHAQLLLRTALQAGFRESGAINIASQTETSTMPIVAIRSMGLGFESLIGYEDTDGTRHALVPASYLRVLMDIGNRRFAENARRIERFSSAFREIMSEPDAVRVNPEGRPWEDTAARKERMKAEGLRKQAALRKEQNENPESSV